MKNKKIYTITCHNVYNYGASLQEYALLSYLESLGYDVATINYTPEYLNWHFNFFSVENPKFRKNFFTKLIYIILKFPLKLRLFPKKISFDKFSKKYIKETKKRYFNFSELKKTPPQADIYITGSDQVWNTFFENGKDASFYLKFAPDNSKKISYAPSFAIEQIDESIKEFVKNNVSQLDAVSVRETSGKNILKELDIQAEVVLDPVFLLDKGHWLALAKKRLEQNYIFIYDFDSNPALKKMAFGYKEKFGWKIITINNNIDYADKNYWTKGPEEFLSLIAYANIILSTSFHALAFSLIFNKDFYIFNRNASINTRMTDLLKQVDLTNRLVNKVDEKVIFAGFDNLNIDYSPVNRKIDQLIETSKSYLKKALDA